MPVTAEGPMSNPLAGLATLVAATASFQAAVGAESTDDALAFVFYPECIEDDPENPAPLTKAIITDSDVCEWEMSQTTGQRGSVLITLTRAIPDDYAARSPDALLDFTNWAGNVCFEMLQLANTPTETGHHWNLINLVRLIAPDLDDSRQKTSTDHTERDPWCFEVTLIAYYV